MVKYRFILSNGEEDRVSHPVYKDDLGLEWAFESQQYFRRANLSGNLKFVGSDFDWLMAVDFEQKIGVTLKVDWAGNGNWSNYWQGSFHQTDCTINYDNKIISVKPNVEDRYNKVLAALENEYDLIKLTPAVQPVNMTRRPMLQVYSAGEEVVSCFVSSMAWEQECDSVTNANKLVNDYHFAKIGSYVEIGFDDRTFTGTWMIRGREETGEWNDFGNDGTYQVNYYQEYYNVEGVETYINGIRVRALGTQTLIWQYSQSTLSYYSPLPNQFTLIAQQSGYSNKQATSIKTDIYGRWCVAAELTGCYAIPQDDLVAYNRNYKYCKPYNGEECILMNYESSDTPTEWGLNSNGKYYTMPTNETPYAYKYFPVSRSNWGRASLWYVQDANRRLEEESLYVPTLLRDAFTIEAVIKVLLNTIDPTITFDATAAYSQFLFGTNPLLQQWGRLVITPKSNVLVAEYTQPSQKAIITLAQVLKMLRDCCGCYWFIDAQNRFRIEHIRWFKNGGSYSTQGTVGIDLTTIYNSRNGKTWAFGTNEITYEKIDMAQRYEYSWMDDTTETFRGQPIEILSTFVEQGKIEEINIDGFNSDVDYMMLNPSKVSEDGFALLCCEVVNGEYSVPISFVIDVLNRCQNYLLAMGILQYYFLRDDLSAWNIKINGVETTAFGIQRKKQQKVKIPMGAVEPDLQKLVKTGIGQGEIKTMNINLSSRMAETILMYDTTEQ